MRWGRWILGGPAVLLVGSAVQAASGHADPVAPVIAMLAVILVAAKIGGDLATRIGQPAVLGELAAGVVLGNLGLAGVTMLEPIKTSAAIELLSGLGVLILLFEVGLESTVGQMMKVGASSLLVATLGVVAPFGLGWAVSTWLEPAGSIYLHLFHGAALCATSVGITARVFQDLGRGQSDEARIILGAAVIDDVMGLVVLSAVTGLILAADAGRAFSPGTIAWPMIKAVVFLAAALTAGVFVTPKIFAVASRLRGGGTLLAVGLTLCFVLAWVASRIDLAPIVGAFAAGLILEPAHYRSFEKRGEAGLPKQLHPIGSFLVPVFFILMGMRTDLRAFVEPGVLGLAAALTAAAIVGKQLCSLGVLGRGVDRLTVGIGMIPRGEVGLIFAGIGAGLTVRGERIVDDAVFSAIVVMVVVTTFITPPLLKWSIGRGKR